MCKSYKTFSRIHQEICSSENAVYYHTMSESTASRSYDTSRNNAYHSSDSSPVFVLVTEALDYYEQMNVKGLIGGKLIYLSPHHVRRQDCHDIKQLLQPASAVLIDWSMESANLVVMLRSHRCRQDVPIVALCGDEEADHVAALIVGADGTMHRQLNPIMLHAKLIAYRRAIELKKHSEYQCPQGEQGMSVASEDSVLWQDRGRENTEALQKQRDDTFEIDPAARVLHVHGQLISLTPKEFDVIVLLSQNEGVCVRRDELINRIWGIAYETGTNFLDVHIHALRHKLKKAGLVSCIHTVRGVGYRFQIMPIPTAWIGGVDR